VLLCEVEVLAEDDDDTEDVSAATQRPPRASGTAHIEKCTRICQSGQASNYLSYSTQLPTAPLQSAAGLRV